MNENDKELNLSAIAKFKGKLLYYSFALSGLNALYQISIQKNLQSAHSITLILSLLMLYKFRPSKIANFVRSLEDKKIIPMKKNSMFIWVFIFGYTIYEQLTLVLNSKVSFNLHNISIILISVISLIFILDKEISSLIWKKTSKP